MLKRLLLIIFCLQTLAIYADDFKVDQTTFQKLSVTFQKFCAFYPGAGITVALPKKLNVDVTVNALYPTREKKLPTTSKKLYKVRLVDFLAKRELISIKSWKVYGGIGVAHALYQDPYISAQKVDGYADQEPLLAIEEPVKHFNKAHITLQATYLMKYAAFNVGFSYDFFNTNSVEVINQPIWLRCSLTFPFKIINR